MITEGAFIIFRVDAAFVLLVSNIKRPARLANIPFEAHFTTKFIYNKTVFTSKFIGKLITNITIYVSVSKIILSKTLEQKFCWFTN